MFALLTANFKLASIQLFCNQIRDDDFSFLIPVQYLDHVLITRLQQLSSSKTSYHKLSTSDPNNENDTQNETEEDMNMPDAKMGANESTSSPEPVVAEVFKSPEENSEPETVVNIANSKIGSSESTTFPNPFIKGVPESSEDNSKPKTEVPKIKLCGVCKQKEGKYKCSRCYLP